MQEQNTRWTVAGIILIVAVVGIYMLYGAGSRPLGQAGQPVTGGDDASKTPTDTTGNSSAKTSPEKIISSDTFTLRNNIQYTLESFSIKDAAGTIVRTDQRLMSSVAGKRVTVVSSIKQAVPEIGAEILKKFVVRQNPQLVVFVSVSPNSATSYGGLYKFDLPTKKFSKMAASRFLPFAISVEANPALFSLDQTKFLSVIDRSTVDQKETKYLYLVDLAADQARSIADVNTGESLTQSIGFGGIPVGVYQWSAPITITYSVFNANSPLDLSGKTLRVPLQVRVVQINPDQK